MAEHMSACHAQAATAKDSYDHTVGSSWNCWIMLEYGRPDGVPASGLLDDWSGTKDRRRVCCIYSCSHWSAIGSSMILR